jgi:hypothetical protein
MKNSLFKDAYGDYSSKRVFGALIIVYSMIQSALDGLDWYKVNEVIVIAQFGIGATLLGLDSITEVWKQPKIEKDEKDIKTEPE